MSTTNIPAPAKPPNPVAFDDAYYYSLPHEIRELIFGASNGAIPSNNVPGGTSAGQHASQNVSYSDQESRTARAIALANKGFLIDTPIMIWGWDPYKVMVLRKQYGYTWVPSALQSPVQIAPGLSVPGSTLTPYDPLHPPPGAIKVSTDTADFPPFDPPVAPQPATDDPVGGQNVGNIYYATPGEAYPDGAKFTDPRGTFLKHVVIYPFGRTGYWEMMS